MDELIAKHLADKRARKEATKKTKVRSKYGTTTYPAAPVAGDKRQRHQSADGAKRRKATDGPSAEQDTTKYRKPRKVPGQASDKKSNTSSVRKRQVKDSCPPKRPTLSLVCSDVGIDEDYEKSPLRKNVEWLGGKHSWNQYAYA